MMKSVVNANPKPRSTDAKLAELILYIAERCENDPDFGALKLNKILFNADFIAYAMKGKPITGAEYQKLRNGPAPRRLVPVMRALQAKKHAATQERKRFGYPKDPGDTQNRTVALRDPDLTLFTAEEIAIVDDVIDRLRGLTGTQVSDLSHDFIGWQVAREGETIPYQTVYLSNRPLTDEEKDYGRKLAARP